MSSEGDRKTLGKIIARYNKIYKSKDTENILGKKLEAVKNMWMSHFGRSVPSALYNPTEALSKGYGISIRESYGNMGLDAKLRSGVAGHLFRTKVEGKDKERVLRPRNNSLIFNFLNNASDTWKPPSGYIKLFYSDGDGFVKNIGYTAGTLGNTLYINVSYISSDPLSAISGAYKETMEEISNREEAQREQVSNEELIEQLDNVTLNPPIDLGWAKVKYIYFYPNSRIVTDIVIDYKGKERAYDVNSSSQALKNTFDDFKKAMQNKHTGHEASFLLEYKVDGEKQASGKIFLNLIKLANHLDSKGLIKEANYIDEILVKQSSSKSLVDALVGKENFGDNRDFFIEEEEIDDNNVDDKVNCG